MKRQCKSVYESLLIKAITHSGGSQVEYFTQSKCFSRYRVQCANLNILITSEISVEYLIAGSLLMQTRNWGKTGNNCSW